MLVKAEEIKIGMNINTRADVRGFFIANNLKVDHISHFKFSSRKEDKKFNDAICFTNLETCETVIVKKSTLVFVAE